MENQKKPDDWDWVSERAATNPALMFRELRTLVERDVASRNLIHPAGQPDDRFQFVPLNKAFSVSDSWMRRNFGGQAGVMFDLHYDGTIEIRPALPTHPAFKATVVLTDDGERRFKVGDEVIAPWQLVRRALEPLFFENDEFS